MGTFHAPNVTGEALKTAVFTAALFEGFGFDVTPRYDEPRADIIQAVQLREREALCAFIRGIQQGAPGRFLRCAGAEPHAGLRLRRHHGVRLVHVWLVH